MVPRLMYLLFYTFLKPVLIKSFDRHGYGHVWLGGVAVTEGTWKWSDGTPWGYERWAPGEPSDPNENHLMMYGSRDPTYKGSNLKNPGLWNDVYATAKYEFICQC